MKSKRSKFLMLFTPLSSRSQFYLFGIVTIAVCLLSFSGLSYARPHEQDIQQQYKVLAPYKAQIEKRLESASPLVDHIFKQLKHKSLPTSLVLVPMLESSYQTEVVSHANAAGLWQLIPATAERFGLQVSANRDERFDSKASTQAALAYLTFLYQKFDQDIALTLAAYNAGEGRVAKAIKAAGSPQFSKLKLPNETKQYVHRFFALQQLVDVNQLQGKTFQPFSLFSSPNQLQPLVDLERLPPLIQL